MLCVEVLSSNRAADTVVKSTKYAAGGVDHYWTVDLERGAIDVFRREDTTYRLVRTVTADSSALVGFGAGGVTLDLAGLIA